MRNKEMLKMVIVFLLVNVGAASAFYTIAPNCHNDVCISNQEIIWNVTIETRGEDRVEYTSIELLDRRDNTIIAIWDPPFNPLSSERGSTVTIFATKAQLFNVTGVLPRTGVNRQLVYYPCFTTATRGDDWVHITDDIYELRHCYFNHTMTVFECVENSHCTGDQQCVGNNCIPFTCEGCQFITNHSCQPHECCDSSVCQENEECLDNKCTQLTCNPTETIVDHVCEQLNCTSSQVLGNHTCIDLECPPGQAAIDHSCQPLECADDEYIVNNTCTPVLCSDNEYPTNHTCTPLVCAYNQKIINHECVDLNCKIYQRIENHECATVRQDVYRLLAEIVALLTISLFVFLDIRKIEKSHHEESYKTNHEKD